MNNYLNKLFIINILTIFSLLLPLMGCYHKNNLTNYIGIARVDIVNNMAKEKSNLVLDVFSSLDLPNLTLYEDDNIIKFTKERYIISLNYKGSMNEGYLHRYTIQFIFREMTVTKLTFIVQEKKISCSIGRFTSKIYEPSTKEISSDISFNKSDTNKYVLKLKVFNQSIKTYYLNETLTVSKKASHDLIIDTIPTSSMQIPPSNIQFYDNMKLSFNEYYYQVEGVLKLDFFTNLKKEYIYASYYLNRIPSLDNLQIKGMATDQLYQVAFE